MLDRPGGLFSFLGLLFQTNVPTWLKKSVKPHALSRIYKPEKTTHNNGTILPKAVFAAPISWDIQQEIQHATKCTALAACPPGHDYVPDHLQGGL